jgi:CheY-like chemotaxis protein
MARHVLVVDDDPLVLDLMTEILEGMGCAVTTAYSGTQALKVLEQNPRIDLLVSDINMPELSGYELAERAKRIRRGLHVLFVSGRETSGHGFPIIRKPFLKEDLISVMRHTTGLC